MNDVTSGKGKATEFTFNGQKVRHASSGIGGVKSVTLFYYEDDDDYFIVAMGEHATSDTYKLSDYGQPDGDLKGGKTVSL